MKTLRYAGLALIPVVYLAFAARRPSAFSVPNDLKDSVGDDKLDALRSGMSRAKQMPQRESGPDDDLAAGAATAAPSAAPAAPPAQGSSVDPATADRIFQNVMEKGESGDAFDGPGFFLYHEESKVESITVNAVAAQGAEGLYQDKSRGHFRGLVIVHTFRNPGCPGDDAKDGRFYQDSWIFDMDFGGAVTDGGRHAFCLKGSGHDAKPVEGSNARPVNAGLSAPGVREEFAKLAPRLPDLEKKGSPYWLEGGK